MSCSAIAEEKQPPQGIWQGTIANQSVIVSFSSENVGYFYLKYLKPISLQSVDGEFKDWFEQVDGKTIAHWHLTHMSQSKITGSWVSSSSTQKNNIQLSTLNSIPQSGYLNISQLAKAFQQKVNSSKVHQFGEHQYRVLSSNNQNNIELIAKSPNIHLLNNMLKIGLRTQVSSYYDCPSPAEMGRGKELERDYQSRVDIKFWNINWIVFEEIQSSDCGGAYPFVDHTKRTVNLNTLKTIQVWTWFKNSKKIDAKKEYDEYYFNYQPPPPIN